MTELQNEPLPFSTIQLWLPQTGHHVSCTISFTEEGVLDVVMEATDGWTRKDIEAMQNALHAVGLLLWRTQRRLTDRKVCPMQVLMPFDTPFT